MRALMIGNSSARRPCLWAVCRVPSDSTCISLVSFQLLGLIA
jgi:hypothetical protein